VSDRPAAGWKKAQDWAILLIGCGLALGLRYTLLRFPSGDFIDQTSHWYQALSEHGFSAFQTAFYNYAPLYLYLLFFVSLAAPGIAPVAAIKLPSILFDFLAAGTAMRIVRLAYPGSPAPRLAFFAVLFAPTVVLNGALWGQADVIYTSLLLVCLYCVLVQKDHLAMLAFGAALAFKLQAVFLAPFLLAMLLKGRLRWRTIAWAPLPYLVSLIPAWLAGRRLLSLLAIYPRQAILFRLLTANAPSLFAWFPQELYDLLAPAGVVWGLCVVFVYLFVVLKSSQPLDLHRLVLLALVSVLALPFNLPMMHERYFFPADLFSIVYAFYFPRNFWVAVVINLVSFFAYQPFLFLREPIPMEFLSLALLGVLAFLGKEMLKGMNRGGPVSE
jgi:Gpi18-like mannosyltransferase